MDLAWSQKFRLTPECKSLQNLGTGPYWTELMVKKCDVFVVKGCIFQIVWTSFVLGLYIWKKIGQWLQMAWVFKTRSVSVLQNLTVRSSLVAASQSLNRRPILNFEKFLHLNQIKKHDRCKQERNLKLWLQSPLQLRGSLQLCACSATSTLNFFVLRNQYTKWHYWLWK